MGKTKGMTGTEPRSGCSWTYADRVLTIIRRPERADAAAIGRIVADQLHLAGQAKEITVVRGDMTLRYRLPEDDAVDESVVVRPRAPEPLTDDGRRHPCPHHRRRKRRKARRAKD